VVAIGETGLDYFRSEGDLSWQQDRFRTHIRAAIRAGKPLIIHTREARADTLKILKEEGADQIGGVLHCFTEDWETARAALDMNFYISLSGILTFRNAEQIQEVAKKVPENRLLIETDSPYLAPIPKRGKPNYPAYVRHVAEFLADLRGNTLQEIADITTRNFYSLFTVSRP
jgi:TatD DNase family protein